MSFVKEKLLVTLTTRTRELVKAALGFLKVPLSLSLSFYLSLSLSLSLFLCLSLSLFLCVCVSLFIFLFLSVYFFLLLSLSCSVSLSKSVSLSSFLLSFSPECRFFHHIAHLFRPTVRLNNFFLKHTLLIFFTLTPLLPFSLNLAT